MQNIYTKAVDEKINEWQILNYPPLTYADATGESAVNGQLVHYPKVVRTMADPQLPNQQFSLMSYMLFKEPRKLKTGNYAYGFVKNRGNYGSKDLAVSEASKIVKNVDSKYKIMIIETGVWVPITEEDSIVKETIDVRTAEDENSLRTEALRQKEDENKQKMREVRDREKELIEGGDIYDEPLSLKYYSMKRVTANMLMERRDLLFAQIDSVKDNLVKTQQELYDIQSIHANYNDEWLECYNEERRKGGVPDFVPPETQIEEHNIAITGYVRDGITPRKVDSLVTNKDVPATGKPDVMPKPIVRNSASPSTVKMVMNQCACTETDAKQLLIDNEFNAVKAILAGKKTT